MINVADTQSKLISDLTTGTCTIPKPTGLAVGDLMVAVLLDNKINK